MAAIVNKQSRQGIGATWIVTLVTLVLAGCAIGADTGEEKVITTPSGLKYVDLKEGNGPAAKKGDTVEVHYTGWLAKDKTKFDSSLDRNEPFAFPLGGRRVIQGWDVGVQGMKVGGLRKLTIPPEEGYGSRGAGGVIPPNATLVFEVELLDVS